MVTPMEEAKKAIQDTIVKIAGIPFFTKKLDVMDDLLEIEWNLRNFENKDKDNLEIAEEWEDLEEEFRGGRETPWCD